MDEGSKRERGRYISREDCFYGGAFPPFPPIPLPPSPFPPSHSFLSEEGKETKEVVWRRKEGGGNVFVRGLSPKAFLYVQEEKRSLLLFVSFDCDSLSEE